LPKGAGDEKLPENSLLRGKEVKVAIAFLGNISEFGSIRAKGYDTGGAAGSEWGEGKLNKPKRVVPAKLYIQGGRSNA